MYQGVPKKEKKVSTPKLHQCGHIERSAESDTGYKRCDVLTAKSIKFQGRSIFVCPAHADKYTTKK